MFFKLKIWWLRARRENLRTAARHASEVVDYYKQIQTECLQEARELTVEIARAEQARGIATAGRVKWG